MLERVVPEGEVPLLKPGDNAIAFTAQGPEDYRTRASVTLISLGEPLG